MFLCGQGWWYLRARTQNCSLCRAAWLGSVPQGARSSFVQFLSKKLLFICKTSVHDGISDLVTLCNSQARKESVPLVLLG